MCLKLDRTKHFSASVVDIAHYESSLPKHQVAADGLVPGDLPHQPSQDWLILAGSEAVPKRQLSHCRLIQHKGMEAMSERETNYTLSSHAQVNDASMSDQEIRGGKAGRGLRKQGAFCCGAIAR